MDKLIYFIVSYTLVFAFMQANANPDTSFNLSNDYNHKSTVQLAENQRSFAKKTCCKLDDNNEVTNEKCYRTFGSCKSGWGEKTD
ncbi:MAG: hypothetical protein PVI97_19245 [Candidatus Thiodiazotropha sp.]|jgi:hypothetical protein